jgi:serine/threonine protein kinase
MGAMLMFRALSFLHDNDVIHGDIKAGNVLLADGDMDRRGYIAKVTGASQMAETGIL